MFSHCVKWSYSRLDFSNLISVAGILVGVTAKFNSFCSSETSVSLKDLQDNPSVLVNTRFIGRRNRGLFLLQEIIKFTLLSVVCLIKDSLSVATDLFKYFRSIFGQKGKRKYLTVQKISKQFYDVINVT